MRTRRQYFSTWPVMALIGAVSLMIITSCGDQSVTPQVSTSSSTVVAKGAEVNELPRNGRQVSAVAPPKAVFGMIWVNTTDNREYIFDGTEWVPHDQSVDDFYLAKEIQAKNSAKTVALEASEVCEDGDPSCTPTGAHGKHSGFDCKVCHNVGGRLAFAKTGVNALAYAVGKPAPSFDATTKVCSNVACHGVPAGTFSYFFPGNEDNDGDGYPDAELKTVNYGGTLAASTPSWYTTGASCTACHGNPPANGSDGSNAWHSGFHANNQNVGATGPNACELCHNNPANVNDPIAQSSNGVGTAILIPALHANGTVNIYARFRSQCLGCH